jgi:Pentapeptide repeats (8 copies)
MDYQDICTRFNAGADLEGANLTGADLRGANLIAASLTDVKLRVANLAGADLEGANLEGADLEGADLRGANLASVKLRVANLAGADLEGANLAGANLEGADLRGVDLSGADLRGADLRGVKGVGNKKDEIEFATKLLQKISDHTVKLVMSNWHCGTAHCIAGWAYPEESYPGQKASLKYPTLAKYFFASEKEALAALQRVANGVESAFG